MVADCWLTYGERVEIHRGAGHRPLQINCQLPPTRPQKFEVHFVLIGYPCEYLSIFIFV